MPKAIEQVTMQSKPLEISIVSKHQIGHWPIVLDAQRRCGYCRKQTGVIEYIMFRCDVSLCLGMARNCFFDYYN